MNNYVYTKSELLEKYNQVDFKSDLFTTDGLAVSSLILEKEKLEKDELAHKKLIGLSSCFILEENQGVQVNRKKSIPCWRKLSEPLRLSPWTVANQVQLNFSGKIDKNATQLKKSSSGHFLSQSETPELETAQTPSVDSIMKLFIRKEINGQDNSHEFKINNLRHIKDNNKIEWYIHSEQYGLEIGPFKTDQVIELYNSKLINQFTKIRLDPQYYEMITDGLKKSPIEHFLIKDLCGVFSIKEKCANKPKVAQEEEVKYKPPQKTYKKKNSHEYSYGHNCIDYYIYNTCDYAK
jgi:hypothetical protein